MRCEKCIEKEKNNKKAIKIVEALMTGLMVFGQIIATAIFLAMLAGNGIQYYDKWIILPLISTITGTIIFSYAYIKKQ